MELIVMTLVCAVLVLLLLRYANTPWPTAEPVAEPVDPETVARERELTAFKAYAACYGRGRGRARRRGR